MLGLFEKPGYAGDAVRTVRCARHRRFSMWWFPPQRQNEQPRDEVHYSERQMFS
ncbi:hypothetical protein G3N92_18385 [Burkholderia sp. Ac-20379]|nr:hypothetical protein [Burkholderia sp. Ac-20379]